jgi:predicted transcriptional regulator
MPRDLPLLSRRTIMNEVTRSTHANILELTTDLVASFLSKNKIPVSDVSSVIKEVHATFSSVARGKTEAEPQDLNPAVPIKNSVKPDYIICLEDGKKFKSLKRHIRSAFNLSPEEYRKKWGLKHDYPMVAPIYAAQRSQLAKKMGLGSARLGKGKGEAATAPEKASTPGPKKGRSRKQTA